MKVGNLSGIIMTTASPTATWTDPALQNLIADMRERWVDIVLVYNVDRLTRSLTDFVKLVELFDAYGVAFMSVTRAWEGSLSTCCYRSPSSNERSPTSVFATKSPPPRRKNFGSAAWFLSVTNSEITS